MPSDLAQSIPSGSRLVDDSLCIHAEGRFWDVSSCSSVCAGDRVSIPAQPKNPHRLLVVFREEMTGVLRSIQATPLLCFVGVMPGSPVQVRLDPQQLAQRTAAAEAPCAELQSTSASLRRLRNQGRTGPKPSRPVHSGSVKPWGWAFRSPGWF